MARFEEGDFIGVKEELSNVEGASLEDIGSLKPQPKLKWSPKNLLEVTQKEYLRGVTLGEVTADIKEEMYVYLKWQFVDSNKLRGEYTIYTVFIIFVYNYKTVEAVCILLTGNWCEII